MLEKYGFRWRLSTAIFQCLIGGLFAFNTIYAQNTLKVNHVEWLYLPTLKATRSIHDVFQDKQGILWIGTLDGLFRYDGVRIEKHILGSQILSLEGAINGIEEDGQGNLWIGTDHGLYILNPTRSSLLPIADFGLPAYLGQHFVNVTNGPDDGLYIAVGNQLFLYHAHRIDLKWTLQEEPFYKPFVLLYNRLGESLYVWDDSYKAGRLHVLSNNGLATKLDVLCGQMSDKPLLAPWIKYYHTADTVKLFYGYDYYHPSNFELKLVLDANCIQAVTGRGIESVFPMETALIDSFVQSHFYTSKEQSGFMLRQIYQLPNGLHAFTSTEGICLLSPPKTMFHQVKASIGERIRAIQGDSYGHLIYGTYDDLLWQNLNENKSRVLIKDWLAWSIEPLDKVPTRFLLVRNNQKKQWQYAYSTPEGVFTDFPLAHDPTPTTQTSLATAYDTLRNGIWHYLVQRGGRCPLLFTGLNSGQDYLVGEISGMGTPRSIIAGSNLWLASTKGVKRFINPQPTLGRLHEDTASVPYLIRKLPVFCAYAASDSVIWLGTDGKGLFRYLPYSGTYEQFTPEDGLPDNSVFSIIGELGNDVLWLGTGKGLCRMEVKNRWFQNYYKEDGLASNEFNTAATYRAPDGTIYMGGQNGITFFDPALFHSTVRPLRQMAQISLLGANGADEIQNLFVNNGAVVSVDANVTLLKIAFRTDDYLNSGLQRFRYRIPGLIESWQWLNGEDQAVFSYLPSGKHRLEVQVCTARGVWLPPVAYVLDVSPKWYNTWWFRLLVGSGIMLVIYALYNFRINQLRREFDLRQQVSHDLHDSLGARIYLLQSLSRQITGPTASDEERRSKLEQFDRISKEAFQSIRDFIWVFDPKQDELGQLFDRMEDFAENYIAPLVAELSVTQPPKTTTIKISPKVKNHVLHLYQEVLTNMLKHTNCKAINIAFDINGHGLMVKIENQHDGLKTALALPNKAHHLGHDSLRYRLAAIHAELDWFETDKTQQTLLKVPV